MFERELKVYAFLLGYAGDLVADIDDADMAIQPAPGINHPAWQLGHLAYATDLCLALLGRSKVLPEPWTKLFAPGTAPTADRSAYPGKAELLSALAHGHASVSPLALNADPSALDTPYPARREALRQAFPTKADILTHLMTSHEAHHLGQLSIWRRMRGKPFLF